jgi:DNA-binding response OmpR family regulator
MRILVAEDDAVSLRILSRLLIDQGHDVVAVRDGEAAWAAMQQPDAPRLAILDWMMPGCDGPTLCRRLRALTIEEPLYLLLVTARGSRSDLVEGLGAGADDYIRKPFDPDELRARVAVGERVVRLQTLLAEKLRELRDALAQVDTLHGLLPICAWCHRVRDDAGAWGGLEQYVREHTAAEFSHGICPECAARVAPEE